MRIFEQSYGSLNEADRLDLARLLVKAGYTVKLGREKPPGKNRYMYFVEFKTNDESGVRT